jgi:putative NADH-flavin reductase
MTLTVFGGTGKTGRLLVEQALAEGHDTTVLVRNPARLDLNRDRLRVVTGDLGEAEGIDDAVRGADAVGSVAGHTKSSGKDVLRQMTRHVVPAMKRHGVRRFVSLVGAGGHDPEDEATFGRTIMRTLMKVLAKDLLVDAEEHARMIRESDLDWTLVRPPRLIDGPRLGGYRTGHLKLGPKQSISRADLADFMLGVAAHGKYVRQASKVSY